MPRGGLRRGRWRPMLTCLSRRWRCPDQRRAARRLQGEAKIPTVHGNVNGLKANHLLRLEHLYRRRGQVYDVWAPSPFHSFQLECEAFVDALETELTRVASDHVVQDGQESAILISVSTRSRGDQEERLEELAELVRSDEITVLESVVQRSQDIHPKYLLGSGKLKEVVIKALQRGADLLIFDQDLTAAQIR